MGNALLPIFGRVRLRAKKLVAHKLWGTVKHMVHHKKRWYVLRSTCRSVPHSFLAGRHDCLTFSKFWESSEFWIIKPSPLHPSTIVVSFASSTSSSRQGRAFAIALPINSFVSLTSSLRQGRAFAIALTINFSAIKVITFYHYVSVQLSDGNA
jgi:hypothetical protein